VERLHVGEQMLRMGIALGGKAARGVEIGPARVVGVDLCSEELQNALRGLRRRGEQRKPSHVLCVLSCLLVGDVATERITVDRPKSNSFL
jgi:hypothetical protein